jgi:predicted metal-dependent hydrolase
MPTPIDLGFSYSKSFTPANIVHSRMSELFRDTPESIRSVAKDLLSKNWSIYVVDQRRGRCYYSAKIITIPVWCLDDKRPGYKIYYIAHELAHVFAPTDSHGQKFMAEFIKLCPKEYLHYELDYKPRSASIAGITNPSDSIFKLLEL